MVHAARDRRGDAIAPGLESTSVPRRCVDAPDRPRLNQE